MVSGTTGQHGQNVTLQARAFKWSSDDVLWLAEGAVHLKLLQVAALTRCTLKREKKGEMLCCILILA